MHIRIMKKKLLVIKYPAEFWNLMTMHKIMKTLEIWHNMIIEDEFDDESLADDEDFEQADPGQVREFTDEECQSMEREAAGVVQ